MKLPLTREEVLEFLKSMPQEEGHMNHYLETEAIMKAVAKHLGEDEDYWAMVGLLHDVDWALTKDNCEEHTVKAEEMLKEKGFDDEFVQIVQSHAYSLEDVPKFKDMKRKSKIEFALVASETLTGIIHAYALMRGNKVSDMKLKGLKKKFKDKAFAAKCNRELIKEIENTGLELGQFLEISIEAFRGIAGEVGLS